MKRRTLLQAGAAGALMAGESGFSRAKSSSSRDQDRRQELYGLLGKLPPRDRAVTAQRISSEDRGGYTLESTASVRQ